LADNASHDYTGPEDYVVNRKQEIMDESVSSFFFQFELCYVHEKSWPSLAPIISNPLFLEGKDTAKQNEKMTQFEP
jgi:hypothetical protein